MFGIFGQTATGLQWIGNANNETEARAQMEEQPEEAYDALFVIPLTAFKQPD